MRAQILHRNSESVQPLAGCPRPSFWPCESIAREAFPLSTRWEVINPTNIVSIRRYSLSNNPNYCKSNRNRCSDF